MELVDCLTLSSILNHRTQREARLGKLDKIRIKGFRSIKDQTVALGPINILIGGNGSGKSNFIEAFKLLREISEGRLTEYVKRSGGADRILHFGTKETESLQFKAYFNDSVDQYEISLEPTDLSGLIPMREVASYWNKSYPQPYNKSLSSFGGEAAISGDNVDGVSSYVKTALSSWRVYHFHDTGPSSPMKKVAELDDNRFLRPDGSNLASFLYYLKQAHEPEYNLIRGAIRRVAPFFDDFVLEPRALDETRIRLEWKHSSSDAFFDVASFSDGTLRFIALAVLLLQPTEFRPSVILVDEPELGLHPAAITLLGAMVRQASDKGQVILSTQSPFLLDHFAPEEVIVADREDGTSVFTRLESVTLTEWLEDFSLGELWEKNELGGRPRGS
ncbi:AAA family ATPase [Rhizobium sp. Leaf384]|nr:AAA family ATPase [Rhizobium sp. Leaf384]